MAFSLYVMYIILILLLSFDSDTILSIPLLPNTAYSSQSERMDSLVDVLPLSITPVWKEYPHLSDIPVWNERYPLIVCNDPPEYSDTSVLNDDPPVWNEHAHLSDIPVWNERCPLIVFNETPMPSDVSVLNDVPPLSKAGPLCECLSITPVWNEHPHLSDIPVWNGRHPLMVFNDPPIPSETPPPPLIGDIPVSITPPLSDTPVLLQLNHVPHFEVDRGVESGRKPSGVLHPLNLSNSLLFIYIFLSPSCFILAVLILS